MSLRISHTTLVCLYLFISAWMCCCLHLSSTCSHVSASVELQIGYVLDGKAPLPKKSCFRAWPTYCPIQNFIKHVFLLICDGGIRPKVI